VYRNKKLLKLAENIHYCQSCGQEAPGQIVMAHSNQSRDGKGMGIKAHDYRVAALCFTCHSELDNGKLYSRSEAVEMWELAHRKTIGYLFEAGLINVVI
jgi:hypothetical protein